MVYALNNIDPIYKLSYNGYEGSAIALATLLAKDGNIMASKALADLLIHRFKEVDLGFNLYKQALACIDKANHTSNALVESRSDIMNTFYQSNSDSSKFIEVTELKAREKPQPTTRDKVEILDTMLRMIHHHPTIVNKPVDEALALHKEILSLDPDYASPEVAIMYDFTLGDYNKARVEYKKWFDKNNNYNTAGSDLFWLFNLHAIKLLLGSLENKLAGKENSCNHPYFAEFLNARKNGIEFLVQDNFFCKAISVLSELRSGTYDKVTVSKFLAENENNYCLGFGTCDYNILGGSIASNLLAGRDPEFALELLKQESQTSYYAGIADYALYAVEDFQRDPVARITGDLTLDNFLPQECLAA